MRPAISFFSQQKLGKSLLGKWLFFVELAKIFEKGKFLWVDLLLLFDLLFAALD